MKRLLVTGASGLLGLNMAVQVSEQYEVIGSVYQHQLKEVPFETLTVDLSCEGAAQQLVETVKPDVIVNCAALANVDACEKQPEFAYQLNAGLPGELAAAAAEADAKFVHLSTDAVFDGQKGNYTEEDQPNPINKYAQTKLEGEKAVEKANPDAIIARVNFYGWSLLGRRSLAEFFFTNLRDGKNVKGFTDVHFCPLQVNDLAEILLEMAEKNLRGMYHVVSPESQSKYDFGLAIAEKFGFDQTLIAPASVNDGGLQAVRSNNLTMCVDKLSAALNRELPGQEAGLTRFYQLFVEGYPEKIHSYHLLED